MIRDEAEKLSAALQERFGAGGSGITTAVESQSTRVEFTAPGGARPHIIRYQIKVSGGGRVAHLDLDNAEALLSAVPAVPAGEGPDRLFEQIVALGLSVEAAD